MRYTNFTMFGREYPKEKQAEGLAISQAIAIGKCNKCWFLKQCESDRNFAFPGGGFVDGRVRQEASMIQSRNYLGLCLIMGMYGKISSAAWKRPFGVYKPEFMPFHGFEALFWRDMPELPPGVKLHF